MSGDDDARQIRSDVAEGFIGVEPDGTLLRRSRGFAGAGHDGVYVAQMGPRQEEGVRFLIEEVLPLV